MENQSRCAGCMADKGDAIVCPRCGWNDNAAPPSTLYLPRRTVLHGQYLIGRVLGHGGFGVTYLGWDLNLDIKLAIKEFLPQQLVSRRNDWTTVYAYDSESQQAFAYGLERFLDEARTLARFQDHAGVVSVFNFFRENGTGYMVMPFVEGQTLQDVLDQQGGRIPVETALSLFNLVMDALRAVHQVGMLHRDISPDNIYIAADGKVMLLDFGAARYSMGEQSKSLSVILKPGYAPEEQYRRRGSQGPWTDIYAMGATFYHAITGLVPPEALERQAQDTLQPPSQLGVVIPPPVEQALLKALAVHSEDRYQDVAALQGALQGTEKTAVSTPSSDANQRGNAGPSLPTSARAVRTVSAGWIWTGVAITVLLGILALNEPDRFSIFFIVSLVVDGLYALYWLTSNRSAAGLVAPTPGVNDQEAAMSPLPSKAAIPSPPAESAHASRLLHCLEGEYAGSRLEIPREGIVIGRDPDQANLVLHDEEVSRRHACISLANGDPGTVILEDLGSTHGTHLQTINDETGELIWTPLESPSPLSKWERFRIGKEGAVFEIS